jgi:hypothetical protein
MRRRNVRYSVNPERFFIHTLPVDENLFYKGVDKKAVHGARLQQSLSHPEAELIAPPDSIEGLGDDKHPPYPFESGATLLALTQRHNASESRAECV